MWDSNRNNNQFEYYGRYYRRTTDIKLDAIYYEYLLSFWPVRGLYLH